MSTCKLRPDSGTQPGPRYQNRDPSCGVMIYSLCGMGAILSSHFFSGGEFVVKIMGQSGVTPHKPVPIANVSRRPVCVSDIRFVTSQTQIR